MRRLPLLACALALAGCVLVPEGAEVTTGPPTSPATDGTSDAAPTTDDEHAVVEREAGGGEAPTDPPPPGDAVIGEVERVVDGDTVVVEVDGERERVRLLRIDTPELARDGEDAECLAEEATDALEALLRPGEPVLLATDVEARDQYGRLLAHVWTRATWVNAQMLRDGWAQVVTFPPNTAYDDQVLAAQRSAVEAGVGLWDEAACP